MNFAEFIAPKTVESFLSEDYGRRPVHIRGESPRAGLLSMARLEQLLSVRPHWTEANLKLILNSRPVLGEHYMDRTASGLTCADPAKVQLFLRMGASLVGDHIEDIDPAVRQAANMLSDQFAGTAGANVYCSFKNIRAFNSHCDLHEVFAVQLEGEKVWQIYENRADAPVEALEGKDAQAIIDQAKGRVMMTVRMQPGDLLYIPRGYFHDALADSDASLHLTFGVKPLDGRIVFRLLEDLAVQNSGFRAYLPDGRTDAAGLREHLEHISEKLTGILRSPEFEDRLRNRQRAVVSREHRVDMKGAQARLLCSYRNARRSHRRHAASWRRGRSPWPTGRGSRMGDRASCIFATAASGAIPMAFRSGGTKPYPAARSCRCDHTLRTAALDRKDANYPPGILCPNRSRARSGLHP